MSGISVFTNGHFLIYKAFFFLIQVNPKGERYGHSKQRDLLRTLFFSDKVDDGKDSFTFVFARHPISRIVSCYHDNLSILFPMVYDKVSSWAKFVEKAWNPFYFSFYVECKCEFIFYWQNRDESSLCTFICLFGAFAVFIRLKYSSQEFFLAHFPGHCGTGGPETTIFI